MQGSLLHGYEPEAGIVAVTLLNDTTVRLYKKEAGKLTSRDAEFFPFFFLSNAHLLDSFNRHCWLKELEGSNRFKFLAAFSRWSDMWEAVQCVVREHNASSGLRAASYADVEGILIKTDPTHQFLLQSRLTLFQGLEFRDLRRMHVAIQTFSKLNKTSDARRSDDRILAVGITTSDHKQFTFGSQEQSEADLLRRFIDFVVTDDPDIIAGDNLHEHLLPYLFQRATMHSIAMDLGRDGGTLRQFPFRSGMVPGEAERPLFELQGRHLIDLVQLKDFSVNVSKVAGKMDAYLAARTEQREETGQTGGVAQLWKQSPQKVEKFLLRKAAEVESFTDDLLPLHVELARLLPFNLASIARIGSVARVESLMLREYLAARASVPGLESHAPISVETAEAIRSGLFSKVVQVDISELIPRILQRDHTEPDAEGLHVFGRLLEELLSQLGMSGGVEVSRSEARPGHTQAHEALKILLESLFPTLSFPRSHFCSPRKRAAVLQAVRATQNEIIHRAELHNGTPVFFDTRSLFFALPDNVVGHEAVEHLLSRISQNLPLDVRLSTTKRFQKMLCLNRRTFALLTEDNKIMLRAGSLLPRSTERFIRQFHLRCLECLLTEDLAQLHHAYVSFHTQILKRQWTVGDFCRKETIREDLETYIREVEQGRRNLSAPYEAARKASLFANDGTDITYYITGSAPDVTLAEHARIAEEWDQNLPDENTPYYLARLREHTEKYRELFDSQAFERIFSLDSLFAFSPGEVRIVNREIQPVSEPPASPSMRGEEEFDIWLAGA